MRILITTDTVGGVWTFTRQLSSDLLERGHHVALVSLGDRPPDRSRVVHGRGCYLRFGVSLRSSDAPLEWMQNNERAYADGLDEICSACIDEFMPEVMLSSQYCFGKLPHRHPKSHRRAQRRSELVKGLPR